MNAEVFFVKIEKKFSDCTLCLRYLLVKCVFIFELSVLFDMKDLCCGV